MFHRPKGLTSYQNALPRHAKGLSGHVERMFGHADAHPHGVERIPRDMDAPPRQLECVPPVPIRLTNEGTGQINDLEGVIIHTSD